MTETSSDLIEWTPPPVHLVAHYEVDHRYPCPSTITLDITSNPDSGGVFALVRAAVDALARVPASAAHELAARRAQHRVTVADEDLL